MWCGSLWIERGSIFSDDWISTEQRKLVNLVQNDMILDTTVMVKDVVNGEGMWNLDFASNLANYRDG